LEEGNKNKVGIAGGINAKGIAKGAEGVAKFAELTISLINSYIWSD
jgi:hypothetical protein